MKRGRGYIMSRGLNESLLELFKNGHLNTLIQCVRADKDLDFQIRENYINIYYKGHSLVKLSENLKIESAFIKNTQAPLYLNNEEDTKKFIATMPVIKEEIRSWRVENNKENLEGEYEQLLIRANNLEEKTASEYYMIDRQYQTEKEMGMNRFDLTGFYWNNKSPRSNKVVPLSFIEVKFGLNNDIQNLHEQLERYYNYVKNHTNELVEEYQVIFAQKLKLNLMNQNEDKLRALSEVKFSNNIDDFRFVIVLVDYNPRGKLVERAKIGLKKLSFADQIRIYYTGFALWEQNAELL